MYRLLFKCRSIQDDYFIVQSVQVEDFTNDYNLTMK